MHGDLDQKLRMKILQAFRDGELKLLIASDVAARGLDIPNVSHIFNFDVPIHSEDYVHRIGRTGRAGRWGVSITLCLPHEEKYLAKIEELVKKPIPPMESPLKSDDAFEARAPREPAARRPRPDRGRRGDPRPERHAAEPTLTSTSTSTPTPRPPPHIAAPAPQPAPAPRGRAGPRPPREAASGCRAWATTCRPS